MTTVPQTDVNAQADELLAQIQRLLGDKPLDLKALVKRQIERDRETEQRAKIELEVKRQSELASYRELVASNIQSTLPSGLEEMLRQYEIAEVAISLVDGNIHVESRPLVTRGVKTTTRKSGTDRLDITGWYVRLPKFQQEFIDAKVRESKSWDDVDTKRQATATSNIRRKYLMNPTLLPQVEPA